MVSRVESDRGDAGLDIAKHSKAVSRNGYRLSCFPKFKLDIWALVEYPIAHMMVSITGDLTLGATTPEGFSANLDSILQENKQLKAMAETAPDLSAIEKRIAALEQRPQITESRITELVTAGVTSGVAASMTTWAASDAGKKVIGSEASRITMEAMAAIGTAPVKVSPAPVVTGNSISELEAQGKFAEAYALLTAEQKLDFGDAGSYAAYQKNRNKVRITTRN